MTRRNATMTRSLPGLFMLSLTVIAMANAEGARPATVDDAAKVLDLAAFPLVPGVESPKPRRLAELNYEAKASVAEAFAFQKKALVEKGSSERAGGYSSDQGASGTFEKDGYRISVSVFPSSKPGNVSVMVMNHGNVDTRTLPVPDGAKLLYETPVSTAYVTEKPLAPTAEACRKALLALGWQPYGTAGDTQFFKQNAIRLGVRVSSAPAQGNKTVIDFSTALMSADLPAPADTVRTSYADVTKEVSFDTKANSDAILSFYRDILGKGGWKPSTQSPVKIDHKDALFFLNPRKDLLSLTMYPVEGILRVSLRHESAAELEELKRLAEARKAKKPAAPAQPKIALTLPTGARGIETSDNRVEFKLDAGKARSAVQTLSAALVKSGWKQELATLEDLAGVVSLKKGNSDLTIHYVDTGLGAAEVTISSIGATLEKPTSK